MNHGPDGAPEREKGLLSYGLGAWTTPQNHRLRFQFFFSKLGKIGLKKMLGGGGFPHWTFFSPGASFSQWTFQ